MHMPLRPPDNLASLIVFDIKPMASWVIAVPLPLPLLRPLKRSGFGLGGGAEDGEEDLHEWVVGVVVAGPYANFGVRITLFVSGQSALGQIQRTISKSLLPEHIRYPPEMRRKDGKLYVHSQSTIGEKVEKPMHSLRMSGML